MQCVMSKRRSETHFISLLHPGPSGAVSAETRRKIRSQAARAAHAKVRRQRVAMYQAMRACGSSEARRLSSCDGSAADVDVPVPSSPATLLGAGRKDPFASFAKHLNSIEHFLLDYCKPPCQKFGSYDKDLLLLSDRPACMFPMH